VLTPEHIFAGLDPGHSSGAIAYCDGTGAPIGAIKLRGTAAKPLTTADLLRSLIRYAPTHAVLERVSAMPKQGVSSTFKFGWSLGCLEALLVASETPHDLVTPAQWQKVMRCRSKGDKSVTKQAAARLFPQVEITNWNADAYLLAEYARRLYAERLGG